MVDTLGRDYAGVSVVAHASGRKPNDDRWTELTIYRHDAEPEGPTAFFAEIIGATQIEGEERRVRRQGFDSVIAALAWGAFNQKTALYDELRRKATSWLEAQIRTEARLHERVVVAASVATASFSLLERAISLLRRLLECSKRKDSRELYRLIDEIDIFLKPLEEQAISDLLRDDDDAAD
jgi:hypothetical protein